MLPRVWRVAETNLRKRGRGDEQLEFPLQFVTFLSIVLVQNLRFKKKFRIYMIRSFGTLGFRRSVERSHELRLTTPQVPTIYPRESRDVA